MSDAFGALEGLGSAAGDLLAGATRAGVAYVVWGALLDTELEYARAAMASFVEDQELRHEAAMRRSEKLRAIGSEATFFSGLARVDGEFRSIRVAVTPQDFVLLDNWNHDPETEIARLPRESVTHAVIVDENGLEVADALLDPIRELETPQQERYAVVLKRTTRAASSRRSRSCSALASRHSSAATATAASSGRGPDRRRRTPSGQVTAAGCRNSQREGVSALR